MHMKNDSGIDKDLKVKLEAASNIITSIDESCRQLEKDPVLEKNIALLKKNLAYLESYVSTDVEKRARISRIVVEIQLNLKWFENELFKRHYGFHEHHKKAMIKEAKKYAEILKSAKFDNAVLTKEKLGKDLSALGALYTEGTVTELSRIYTIFSNEDIRKRREKAEQFETKCTEIIQGIYDKYGNKTDSADYQLAVAQAHVEMAKERMKIMQSSFKDADSKEYVFFRDQCAAGRRNIVGKLELVEVKRVMNAVKEIVKVGGEDLVRAGEREEDFRKNEGKAIDTIISLNKQWCGDSPLPISDALRANVILLRKEIQALSNYASSRGEGEKSNSVRRFASGLKNAQADFLNDLSEMRERFHDAMRSAMRASSEQRSKIISDAEASSTVLTKEKLEKDLSALRESFVQGMSEALPEIYKGGLEEDIKGDTEKTKSEITQFQKKCTEIITNITKDVYDKKYENKTDSVDYRWAVTQACVEMTKERTKIARSSLEATDSPPYTYFRKSCEKCYSPEIKNKLAEHSDSTFKRLIGRVALALTAILSVPIKWAVDYKKTGGEWTWPWTDKTVSQRKAERIMDTVDNIVKIKGPSLTG